MPKSLFRSKTVWANAVALSVGLYQYYVQPIPGADPQVFALAVALINLGLRFVTTQPIAVAR